MTERMVVAFAYFKTGAVIGYNSHTRIVSPNILAVSWGDARDGGFERDSRGNYQNGKDLGTGSFEITFHNGMVIEIPEKQWEQLPQV